jgi:predicted HD phosphohydrolase
MPHEQIATFSSIEDSTREDWALIATDFMKYAQQLPQRIVAHLKLLDDDFGGFPVDRLHHSLLTATLAMQAGRDEEYVACALLHDIGDTLGTFNHPDIAAAILKPFVSEENHWMVEKHGIFQGYYFFHHIGLDRNMREQFRGHPHFLRTAEFCEISSSAHPHHAMRARFTRASCGASPGHSSPGSASHSGQCHHASASVRTLRPLAISQGYTA